MFKLHTDVEWEVTESGGKIEVMRQDGETVAQIISDTPEDDARIIVDSVNNAGQMLKALFRINDALMVDGDCPAGCGGSNDEGHECGCPLLEVREAIGAATQSSSGITKEQEKEYLARKGMVCPVCGTSNIETYGSLEVSSHDSVAYQGVNCLECEATWTDEYRLSGISETEVYRG